MIANLIYCALLPCLQAAKPPQHSVDGVELEGYTIAENYLETVSKKWKKPFLIRNYKVDFEGNWTYHFIPKLGRGEKYGIEYETSLGNVVRVRVDKKTRKVLSAVVE